MSYREEFPEYPESDMPADTAAWEDVSWINDTCPSFICGRNMAVFIDWPNATQRDFPDAARFTLIPTEDGQFFGGDALLHTDSWPDVLAYIATHGEV